MGNADEAIGEAGGKEETPERYAPMETDEGPKENPTRQDQQRRFQDRPMRIHISFVALKGMTRDRSYQLE